MQRSEERRGNESRNSGSTIERRGTYRAPEASTDRNYDRNDNRNDNRNNTETRTWGRSDNRSRDNPGFVGDLYNAFLRRGGDLAGVQYWINQLNARTMTRDQVRQQFEASPEFTGKVNAVVAAGCGL